MALSTLAASDDLSRRSSLAGPVPRDDHAVSWPAIFAGAAGAAALSLILLILGTGLGLSSVSPWVHEGVSATTFGVTTIVWLTATQLIASGAGGYLAGRLRTRWTDAQADEVYFRDTAHGFLAWAIASLTTAALLTSVIGSIVGTGVTAGASVAAGGATAAVAAVSSTAGSGSGKTTGDAQDSMSYFVDALFRSDAAAASASSASGASAPIAASTAAEASRIVVNGLKTGALPPADAAYLGQLVSQRTGLSQQDAQKRVTDSFARIQTQARDAETAARDAADKARKASAYGALWLVVSLLFGAFFASLAATFGGRQRDAV